MDTHELFPVTRSFAYLNAGSVGPMSVTTARAIQQADEIGLTKGRGAPATFHARMELRTELRQAVAGFLRVAPEQIALTGSTTEGCHITISGFGLKPGDEVVTTDAEHPGLEGPLAASPATVKVAKVVGATPGEAVEAIAAEVTPATRLIALSHALWLNGDVLPLAEIKARCGLPMLVDGAQSVGAIDIDVTVADYYTVSGQKWLCGPELTGALFVKDPDSLHPRMDMGDHYPRPGAQKLELLFHPASLTAGLLAAIGDHPSDAPARALALARHCREALAAAGCSIKGGPAVSPLVAFEIPGAGSPCREPADVVAALQAAGVVVRSLPNGWLRASCGWWNSTDDIARLVGALEALPG